MPLLNAPELRRSWLRFLAAWIAPFLLLNAAFFAWGFAKMQAGSAETSCLKERTSWLQGITALNRAVDSLYEIDRQLVDNDKAGAISGLKDAGNELMKRINAIQLDLSRKVSDNAVLSAMEEVADHARKFHQLFTEKFDILDKRLAEYEALIGKDQTELVQKLSDAKNDLDDVSDEMEKLAERVSKVEEKIRGKWDDKEKQALQDVYKKEIPAIIRDINRILR